MWDDRRDWEISVAAALLCHAAFLYGFQLALRPLPLPEPRPLIEMALVPPPGEARDGIPGRAPVEAPHALPSPTPRTTEVPPSRKALRPAPRQQRTAPPVPAEMPAPPDALARPESSTLDAPAPAGPVAPQSPPGTAEGTSDGAEGKSAATGSGSTTGTPGVRARPRYRTNPLPVYPPLARSRHQEGVVLLRVSVSAEGRAARVELEKSSGFSALDTAALEAVREWEFEPARVGARAVSSEIQVPLRFQLDQ